ncbi:MAG: nuclear transport factor 2 family protein [Alphaproteobacteria bacterium]|nr:nuclear transport factor 2 family protein [Alphaproteobacteria bacterium]
MFAPDGRFVDPFSDIRGAARIRQHLARAYERLHDVRITVTDQAFSGRVAYLRWTFGFRLGRGRAVREIIGMSEVHIDDEGRVTLHFDHWDAASQIYEAIPLLGNLLRKIKRRING